MVLDSFNFKEMLVLFGPCSANGDFLELWVFMYMRANFVILMQIVFDKFGNFVVISG